MTDKPKAPAFTDIHDWLRRAPSHRRPELPPLEDIAAQLREGVTIHEIAEVFDRPVSTIRTQLTTAGWSGTTGQPLVAELIPDDVDVIALVKPFRYEPWMDDALCTQTDPEAFFPEKGGSTRGAKSICARCTVAAECFDYALTNKIRHGIWGGLSERERRKIQGFPEDPHNPTQESA